MIDRIRVEPGHSPKIAERDPRDTLGLGDKAGANEQLAKLHERLAFLHDRLYAESRRSVLLVIQGMDASGKDGVIRAVMQGVNPAGCRVVSFKAPVGAELAHDYLWRIHAVLPALGEIGIFNRSHYEDVVTVRMLELAPKEVWSKRPHHLNELERMLTDEGTTLVKVYLNVSRDEQGKRFRERIENPKKRWKFRKADLDVHARYDEYVAAYEDVLEGDVDRAGALARRARRPQLGQGDGGRHAARAHARAARSAAPGRRGRDRADQGRLSDAVTMGAARGGVPEWPKGTGCKPVGSAYGGSNPPAPTLRLAGNDASLCEGLLPRAPRQDTERSSRRG